MAQRAVKSPADLPHDHGQNISDTGKRKFSELSISKKKEVLDLLQAGKSQRELGKMFNVSKSTIFNIKAKQTRIIEAWDRNFALERKRLRRSTTNDEINEQVFTFFVDCRSKNIPISGSMLQEQARLLADALGIDNFKASNGWLASFKKRHNIVSQQFNDDTVEAEGDLQVCVGQDPTIIHVAVHKDEGGLSLRQPRKSLVLKQQTCKVEPDADKDPGAASTEMSDVITSINATMWHQHREEGSDRDCEEVAEGDKDQHDKSPQRYQDARIFVNALQRFARETQPEQCFALERKRLKRSTTNDEINEKVFNFFVDCRSKNIPVSGTMLQEQARHLADTLGIDSFKASNGWLASFKKRHNIVSQQFSGDTAEPSDLCVGQDANNSHVAVNKDEGGLPLRQPRKSLVLKQQICKVEPVDENHGCDDGAASAEMSDVITNLNTVMWHQQREEGCDRDCEVDAEADKDRHGKPPLRRQDALMLVKELQRFARETQPELCSVLVGVRQAIEEGILEQKSKTGHQANINRILNKKK